MRILVACEFSRVVAYEFEKLGHEVITCDFKPPEHRGQWRNHYQGDVRDILFDGWDLLIAHPECRYLCVSGARWFKERNKEEQQKAIDFFMQMIHNPIKKKCIENPVGIMSTLYRKPDQYIQPYYFGNYSDKNFYNGYTKKTGLWLINLPKITIKPDNFSRKHIPKCHFESPGEERSSNRSRTYNGIAKAMAETWG